MHRLVALALAIVLSALIAALTAQEPGSPFPAKAEQPAHAGPAASSVLTATARQRPFLIPEHVATGAKDLPTPSPGSIGVVAEGTSIGGIFRDTSLNTEVRVGAMGFGVMSTGPAGAHFEGAGTAALATENIGVFGSAVYIGGYFKGEASSNRYAFAAYNRPSGETDRGGIPNDGEYGVYAGGDKAGGYFEDTDASAYGYVALDDYGVYGRGSFAGGDFGDTDSSGWARVGHGSYKVYGTGQVSFVQNHPDDPSSVIVYAAPEGDEVATYTRGTTRLADGEARVALGETFRWVTNPDIGLTAHITPREDCNGLYVADLSTDEIVVRELAGGTSDCAFDYLVYGLRIGFEETTTVQEKEREAWIPAMTDHRELTARRPDLSRYTALARWTTQAKALGDDEPVDLSRARALRDRIGEYDPALHGSVAPSPPQQREARARVAGAQTRTDPRRLDEEASVTPATTADGDQSASAVAAPPPRDVYARSFRPAASDLATLLPVSEAVAPGDVVAVDPEHPGMLRRAAAASDPTVVGVVAAEPGVVLGSEADAEDRAAVTFAGIAACKVDATYGPVYPGDLLVSSPTPGHAMRADVASPGTVLGKALEELPAGTAAIRILVMPR